MQAKSDSSNRPQLDPSYIPPSAIYTEPWWRSVGYNPISMETGAGETNSSSHECPNGGSESNDGQSLSNGGANEKDDDAIMESQTAVTSRSDRNYHQERQDPQHASPTLPRRSDDCLPHAQAPQLELVGHSIACASNPYLNPYYGGMMAAYGPQPFVHPQFLGTNHARMPLPLELEEEPVYVNAKQYHAILRRRQSRAKAELEKKLIKVRKPYLHESRHQHAIRRARATGGRFAKKVDDGDGLNNAAAEGRSTSSALSSQSQSQSVSSSGSETMPSDSAEYWNSSGGQQEARPPQMNDMSEEHTYGNGSGNCQNNDGLQASSTYHMADRGEEGDCFRPAIGRHLF